MNVFSGTRVPSSLRGLALMTILVSSPALADHSGPSGAVGEGSSITVPGALTLGKGQASAGILFKYIRPDQRSDARLAALSGEHVHAHNVDYTLTASVGLAYGVTDRLTLSMELPYIHRDDLREGEHAHEGSEAVNEVAGLGSVSGVGDLSVIARYRLLDGFAVLGGLKLPTGSTHKRSNEGERLETEHQPGSGSWDPMLGAAFQAALGSVDLHAGALYQFAGKGARDTRLGDRARGGIALVHRFGRPEHHHSDAADGHRDHHEPEAHGHQSWDAFVELTGEWEGRQTVNGDVERDSGGKGLWLSPGARFNAANGFSLAAGIGLPIWQDIRRSHPKEDYRLSLAIGRSF